jgi:hypothetical protein
MKKMYSLDNKLKMYSTLALGVLGASTAGAQVVYHDVNPDVTVTGVSGTASRDSLQLDINNDGTDDFQLQVRVYGTTPTNTQVNMNAYNVGSETLASLVNYTSLGYALDVPAGTAIGSSSAWNNNIQAVLASLYGTTQYGSLGDNADHYLGIKFEDGSANVYYGWVRIGGVDANGTHVTIKDWAYQSTAATPINAGQGAGINNAVTIESNIYVFNKIVNVNLKNESTGSIKVYNAMGELVTNQTINDTKNRIDMQSQSAGVYMIVVETNNGSVAKKVNIL